MEATLSKRNNAVLLLFLATLYQVSHHYTYGLDNFDLQERYSKLKDLIQHDITPPSSLLKFYQTELDYGFKPGSMIVLEGVLEPKSAIKLKELGVKNDKGIEFRFDLNLNKVLFGPELKKHKPSRNNTGHAAVIIESLNEALEICVGVHACRVVRYGHGSINKIEISNMALIDISYYSQTPNDPEVGLYEMGCSKSACDITKMRKKGKAFIFTRKLPTYKKRAHINLEESYKDIAFHMDIRQDQKEVVFNTRAKNKWNKLEERQKAFSFEQGNAYTMAFNVQKYGITISVNGMFYYYYKHRMDPERVKKLWFSWDQEGGNYSFVGVDELGIYKLIKSYPTILQQEPTTVAPFEMLGDQPTLFGSDQLNFGTVPEPELKQIELPKPSKNILSYKTDLICGFSPGSNLNFRSIVRNNSSIFLTPVGENFEIMFMFNLKLNQIEMYTRDARDETVKKGRLRLKEERQIDFSFTSMQDEIEVCADEQCVEFPLLSEINFVEFSNMAMTDISYYVKITAKQRIHHKLNCSEELCDVSHLQKFGSIFTFIVKLPVNETWFKINFRVSEKVVPFHMAVGPEDTKTLITALDPEMDFSREEIASLPLSYGQTHVFKFYIQPFGTLVAVDGYYYHFFRHRLEPEDITEIQYEWDLLDSSYHNDGCYKKPPEDDEYISEELDDDYIE